MAYGDYDKVEGDDGPAPESPRDEQGHMLERRLEEAEAQIEEANRVIREWEPVCRSCRAGLEALSEASAELKAVAR